MKKIVSWSFQVILAVIMGMAGVMKLMSDPDTITLFESLGMEPAGRIVIGILEILAALLLLGTSVTVVRGAFLSFCILLGALIAHLSVIGFGGEMSQTSILWAVAFCTSILLLGLHRKEIPFLGKAFERG
ncbi:MAG: DoxX family protein [Kiritimatiellia bacterium]